MIETIREPWWVPYERPQLTEDIAAGTTGTTYTEADTDPYEATDHLPVADDCTLTPATVLVLLALVIAIGVLGWAAS
jgi:hypothetical protein